MINVTRHNVQNAEEKNRTSWNNSICRFYWTKEIEGTWKASELMPFLVDKFCFVLRWFVVAVVVVIVRRTNDFFSFSFPLSLGLGFKIETKIFFPKNLLHFVHVLIHLWSEVKPVNIAKYFIDIQFLLHRVITNLFYFIETLINRFIIRWESKLVIISAL